jgi:hypothetical protein
MQKHEIEKAERLMKKCQQGVGGRNALENAHAIMAECYGTIGMLLAEVERLTDRQRPDEDDGK